jgi:hypothetical protein
MLEVAATYLARAGPNGSAGSAFSGTGLRRPMTDGRGVEAAVDRLDAGQDTQPFGFVGVHLRQLAEFAVQEGQAGVEVGFARVDPTPHAHGSVDAGLRLGPAVVWVDGTAELRPAAGQTVEGVAFGLEATVRWHRGSVDRDSTPVWRRAGRCASDPLSAYELKHRPEGPL